VNLNTEDIDRLIAEAEEQLELDAVIGTAGLADRILNRRVTPSIPLPWGQTHGLFELRKGELTVWAGDNGSGKSLLVGQVVGWLLAWGERALIASMEMRPEETVARLANQLAGCVPSEAFIRGLCDWGEGRLWLYDRLDTVESERVVRMVRAVTQRLGVTHVVIDSLVKCRVPQDGDGAMTAQTRFVDELQHLAKHLDIHIHLIAHTRKPERGAAKVTKHDIRGASQITDLADNVVLVTRNRRKEELARLDPEDLDDADREELERPDTLLTVAKQRHHTWEGTFGLHFLPESKQYVRHGRTSAMPWPRAYEPPPWELATPWGPAP
jgi:twinkle protein